MNRHILAGPVVGANKQPGSFQAHRARLAQLSTIGDLLSVAQLSSTFHFPLTSASIHISFGVPGLGCLHLPGLLHVLLHILTPKIATFEPPPLSSSHVCAVGAPMLP